MTSNNDFSYRPLFLNNPDLCYFLNSKGEFIELNDTVIQTLQYPINKILNHSFLRVIIPQDHKRLLNIFKDVLNGQRVAFETTVITYHGKEVHLSVTAIPFTHHDGTIGVMGIAKDMTQIINYQKTLKASEKRYKDLIVSTPYPVVVSRNQLFVFANDEAIKALKAPDYESIHGKNVNQTISYFIDEKGDKIGLQSLSDILHYLGKTGELTIQTYAGDFVDVEFAFTEIEWEGELAYLTVFHDITERKQREFQQKKELLLAHQLQKSILPHPIINEKIDIQARFFPSEELSGDLYYWNQLDEHSYGVLILDVMGHGISASLLSMSVRSLLATFVHKYNKPIDLIKELNRYMHQIFKSIGFYMTGIYCEINTELIKVEYINAGHPYGLAVHEGEHIIQLNEGGIPLGMSKEADYSVGSFRFLPSTKLFLYTDGLYDALQLNVKQGSVFLENLMQANISCSPEELLEKICAQMNLSKNPDDVCMIAIHLK